MTIGTPLLNITLLKCGTSKFSNCAESHVAPQALDDDAARKLFITSLRWTRLH